MLPETSELPSVPSTQSVENIRPLEKVKPEEIDFDKDEQIVSIFRTDEDSVDKKLEPNKESELSEVLFYPISMKLQFLRIHCFI